MRNAFHTYAAVHPTLPRSAACRLRLQAWDEFGHDLCGRLWLSGERTALPGPREECFSLTGGTDQRRPRLVPADFFARGEVRDDAAGTKGASPPGPSRARRPPNPAPQRHRPRWRLPAVPAVPLRRRRPCAERLCWRRGPARRSRRDPPRTATRSADRPQGQTGVRTTSSHPSAAAPSAGTRRDVDASERQGESHVRL